MNNADKKAAQQFAALTASALREWVAGLHRDAINADTQWSRERAAASLAGNQQAVRSLDQEFAAWVQGYIKAGQSRR